MAKRIKVRGIPRSEPDVQLYVLALIELARELQAGDQAAGKSEVAHPQPPAETSEGPHD